LVSFASRVFVTDLSTGVSEDFLYVLFVVKFDEHLPFDDVDLERENLMFGLLQLCKYPFMYVVGSNLGTGCVKTAHDGILAVEHVVLLYSRCTFFSSKT
jgi:hypothetical protein